MRFMPYWINSSSNDLIKKLLLKGDNNMKLELEELIEGNSINKVIDDNIVMSEVEDSNKYEVKSNKENGYERYAHIKKCDSTTKNLMIIPKDISKIGIIIEFKKSDYFLDDTIKEVILA